MENINTDVDDDDTPCLSSKTLALLADFYAEQDRQKLDNSIKIDENWQLSQFWYTSDTARCLVDECISAAIQLQQHTSTDTLSIGCISCPTLIDAFNSHEYVRNGRIIVRLFEFDHRFANRYSNQFIDYDYRQPLDISTDWHNYFDVIIADPPFIADECIVKMAQTIRLISKSRDSTRIIICTGIIMQPMLERLLSMHRCVFEPKHVNNLANQFACFANYKTQF
jgi:hypothetical protein